MKVADVIRAFPLQSLGSLAPLMNPHRGKGTYSNLHFRFESCLVNAKTGRRMVVFKDIVCNDGNLKELERVPCPLNDKGEIKIKILLLPSDGRVKKKLTLTSE